MNQALANDNLIKILGIESLPEQQKARILDKATELTQKRLMIRVVNSLAPEKRDGFMSLLDSGDQIGVTNFINHNRPRFQDWVFEEISRIKQELSGLANKQ